MRCGTYCAKEGAVVGVGFGENEDARVYLRKQDWSIGVLFTSGEATEKLRVRGRVEGFSGIGMRRLEGRTWKCGWSLRSDGRRRRRDFV